MPLWRSSVAVAVSVIFALALSGASRPAQTANANAPDRSIAHRLTIVGVPNAGEVTPKLYRGAQPDSEGLPSSGSHGRQHRGGSARLARKTSANE